MAKRIEEEETQKEMYQIKQHLDKQDKQIEHMGKKLDEVLNLLGGNIMFKTKGLVEVVNELAGSLDDMVGKFMHAEKWRQDFKTAQADNENRNEKKRQVAEQREYEAQLKDKEIASLKRSNQIRNLVAAAAVAVTVLKFIYDFIHG